MTLMGEEPRLATFSRSFCCRCTFLLLSTAAANSSLFAAVLSSTAGGADDDEVLGRVAAAAFSPLAASAVSLSRSLISFSFLLNRRRLFFIYRRFSITDWLFSPGFSSLEWRSVGSSSASELDEDREEDESKSDEDEDIEEDEEVIEEEEARESMSHESHSYEDEQHDE